MRAKTGPKPKYQNLVEAIEAQSIPVPFSGCWIWTGSVNKGYGQLTYEGEHLHAHRASFLAHNPDKTNVEFVCHHCDVKACVNPSHLYDGDAITNRKDMLSRKRWSHPFSRNTTCSKGHIYTETGFRFAKDGSRVCMRCQREHKQMQRALKKGA
ncbi:hypothetical protein [Limnobacter sp.]|uniref:hypothetical protein n=1 Tax=Limnobacter sp. TaxID=2003368 RepID=UPI00311E18C9